MRGKPLYSSLYPEIFPCTENISHNSCSVTGNTLKLSLKSTDNLSVVKDRDINLFDLSMMHSSSEGSNLPYRYLYINTPSNPPKLCMNIVDLV